MSQCRPIIMVTHSTNFCSPGAVHLRFRFRRFGSDTCGTCFHPSPWIGRPNRRGGRAEPLFPHALWNCVDAVHADLPKTNNAVEGWHGCSVNFSDQTTLQSGNLFMLCKKSRA